MSNAIKKCILIPVCILYAITPGRRGGYEHTEEFYLEALVLGILQALISPAIYMYFWGSPGDTYLGLVASLGSWLGGWTFIGGIYFPIIAEIYEKEKLDKLHNPQNYRSPEQKQYEAQVKESRGYYWRLLHLNAPSDIHQRSPEGVLETKSGPLCYKLVLEARLLHLLQRGGETEFLWGRDRNFLAEEAKRFGIGEYSEHELQTALRRVDNKYPQLKDEYFTYLKAYFKLLEENKKACHEMIEEAYYLHREGRADGIENALFKNKDFVNGEAFMLNINDHSLNLPRIEKALAEST